MDDDLSSSFVHRPSSTLIVGLGNPILGDDGVGWRVAEQVKQQLEGATHFRSVPHLIEVDCLSLGGLSLMERLAGYEHAVLIDAISTGQTPVGSVYSFALEELPDPSAGHTASVHDTSLLTALKVGRTMGVSLPNEIVVVAIETESTYDFSEELTLPVAAAVPRAVELVLDSLHTDYGHEETRR